jgi:hypothetical protein
VLCLGPHACAVLIPNASRASTCNRQTDHNKKLKEIEEELAKTNRMIRLATPALSLDAAQSKQAGTSACFQFSHKPRRVHTHRRHCRRCRNGLGGMQDMASSAVLACLLLWNSSCVHAIRALDACTYTSAVKALGACTHTSTVHIHKQCVRSVRGDATVRGHTCI